VRVRPPAVDESKCGPNPKHEPKKHERQGSRQKNRRRQTENKNTKLVATVTQRQKHKGGREGERERERVRGREGESGITERDKKIFFFALGPPIPKTVSVEVLSKINRPNQNSSSVCTREGQGQERGRVGGGTEGEQERGTNRKPDPDFFFFHLHKKKLVPSQKLDRKEKKTSNAAEENGCRSGERPGILPRCGGREKGNTARTKEHTEKKSERQKKKKKRRKRVLLSDWLAAIWSAETERVQSTPVEKRTSVLARFRATFWLRRGRVAAGPTRRWRPRYSLCCEWWRETWTRLHLVFGRQVVHSYGRKGARRNRQKDNALQAVGLGTRRRDSATESRQCRKKTKIEATFFTCAAPVMTEYVQRRRRMCPFFVSIKLQPQQGPCGVLLRQRRSQLSLWHGPSDETCMNELARVCRC